MARITLLTLSIMLVVLAAFVDGRFYGRRVRRGFTNSGISGNRGGYGYGNNGGKGTGYDRDSDENDTSDSRENRGGCNNNNNNDRSGSRELAFNRDGRQSGQSGDQMRGGRSFTRSSASASATSFSQSQHQKKNNAEQ